MLKKINYVSMRMVKKKEIIGKFEINQGKTISHRIGHIWITSK
jgi:hypothetical protein